MDNALYIGLSRQMTLQRSLDISANNLANLDTAGFKTESLVVKADPVVNDVAQTPLQYVVDVQMARDFAPGVQEKTGNPLDLAIEGDGFFSLTSANGTLYTRDGRFMVGPDGQMVDKNGKTVQAVGGGSITVDVKKSPPEISRDGTVSQDGKVIGKIAVVRFADRSLLSKIGSNDFAADPNLSAIPANNALVRQGTVEKSNVTPIMEVTNLINISRSYESLVQTINSISDLSKQSVDRLGKAA